MPRFDYQCKKCNHIFEEEHQLGMEPRVRCPVCKGSSKKLISQVSVVFKGSGFYCTDNKKSGGNGSDKKSKPAEVSRKDSSEVKESTKDDSSEVKKSSNED